MPYRSRQGIHRLSAAAIKYITDPGWHGDGGGLYLEVDRNGRKRWAMRLVVNGHRRDFGLGPLHKVSLLQAREQAADYRSKAYRGIDPIEHKRKLQQRSEIPTFEAAAQHVYEQRRSAWRIGKKLVSEIGTPDVLRALSPICISKPETSRRVRQRIGVVLEWARAAGHRTGCFALVGILAVRLISQNSACNNR